MTVRVVPVLEGLEWEPNVPEERFVQDEGGFALLVLNPHFDDPDTRAVGIFWTGVVEATSDGPNDEGRYFFQRHPLMDHGLAELLWAGEVIDDGDLGRRVRHFIIPTTETTVEVRALHIHGVRLETSLTAQDALAMLKRSSP